MSICGTEMNKLMEDCVTTKRIVCEGGLSSCEMVNKTVYDLLEQTLDKELLFYFKLLTNMQKESLLSFVKSFISKDKRIS
jgi:hypothetical protein